MRLRCVLHGEVRCRGPVRGEVYCAACVRAGLKGAVYPVDAGAVQQEIAARQRLLANVPASLHGQILDPVCESTEP